MSDISIPGVSDRYNTTKLISDLMEVEKVKLNRMEESVTNMETEKQIWQDVNRRLGMLRDAARNLTGFDSPFGEKIGISSDEAALSIEASRAADRGDWEVTIIQKAQGDRLISGNIGMDQEVARGNYSFSLGEEEVSFSFRGGKLERFVDTLNDKSKGLLRASLIKNTANSQVLLIEGLKEGAENRISYGEASTELFLQLGLLEENRSGERTVNFEPAAIQNLDDSRGEITFQNDGALLKPGQGVKIPITPTLASTQDMVLEMEVTLTRLSQEDLPVNEGDPGLNLVSPGGIEFKGVQIQNDPLADNLPDTGPPLPPPNRIDMNVLFGIGDERVSLGEIEDITATQTISIPLEVYLDNLNSLEIENNNSYRSLEVKNLRIYNPSAQGDVVPVNSLASAQDAIIELEGVRVVRPSNEIDDLIPGLTLRVKKPTDEPIEINVEPDKEAIKNSLINLLASYNEAIAEINILTNRNSQVIEEIPYFTDEDREAAYERLGQFQGDITLNQLKNRMQRIFQDAYPTSDPNLVMLAQIGISTNASGAGGFDASRLRGYLDLDEELLDQSLETKAEYIQELFGRDTNDDLVIDTGAGFLLDENLKPYTQLGGFLAGKISTIDRSLDRTGREIEEYNDYLEQYELDLRRKYGMMEGVLNSMEGNRNAIDNFTRQNSPQN
jgi:flagellar hook-associated protein 2